MVRQHATIVAGLFIAGGMLHVAQAGCNSGAQYHDCDDCGPCGLGPLSSYSVPLSLAVATNEETAYVSFLWDYVWGECGFEGNGPVASLHVADLVLGSALRIDLPQFIVGMATVPGELVMVDFSDNYLTMPLSPPFIIESVPLADSARGVRRAGNAAFLLLSNGTIVRHVPGEPDFAVDGVDARGMLSAFGRLWAIASADVQEIDPASGSVVRTVALPCPLEDVVPVAPSHFLMACPDGSIALLDLLTGVAQTQVLPGHIDYIGGADHSPVALASYGVEYDATAEGTLAVVPAQGLPAGEVVSAYGGDFPAVRSAIFLRNGVALVDASLVWKLTLSTAGGAVGHTLGTDAHLFWPALPIGADHVIMAGGESSYDYDATLAGGISEQDELSDHIRGVHLVGPPPPNHD